MIKKMLVSFGLPYSTKVEVVHGKYVIAGSKDGLAIEDHGGVR